MKAVVIEGKARRTCCSCATFPVPAPSAGEVLIKVAAAGVNRPDVLQRQGNYPAPKGHSELPGLEVAGVVAALGDGVDRVSVGDAVLALTPGGGYAEYAVAPAGCCIRKPDALSFTDAAAIRRRSSRSGTTSSSAARLKRAKHFSFTEARADRRHGDPTCEGFRRARHHDGRFDEKCDAARTLGADVAINYRSQDFSEVVKAETGKRGVDVILDMVGGDYIDKNIRALADDGRLVNIAYQKVRRRRSTSFA